MRIARPLLLAAVAAAVLVLPAAAPAAASAEDESCAVHADGTVECFDSFEEMERSTPSSPAPFNAHVDELGEARAELSPLATAPSSSGACYYDASRWLYLFSDPYYSGQVTKVQSSGVWHNFWVYGITNNVESAYNQTFCDAYINTAYSGAGSSLRVFPGSGAATFPSWLSNNASSACLEGPPGGPCP